MRARIDPPPLLLRLADRQAGMMTLEQIEAHGLGRGPVDRLVAAGVWQRLGSGLYAAAVGELPWLTQGWAGVLLGGAGSRLGGESAGHLHGIVDEPPGRLQVLIPKDRRRVDRWPWMFTREQDGERLDSTGAPPRTTIEDTVLDLCASLGPAGMTDLITRTVQTRKSTAQRIRRRLDQRTRISGRGYLERLLADVDDGAQSYLELVYLRDVERPHGLPRGRRQVRSGSSVRDVYYEEWHTIVELDGRRGHEGTGRFRDMARDNVSTLSGAATLRFGLHDTVGEGCRVAVMVGSVLQNRGWPGPILRCPRCF